MKDNESLSLQWTGDNRKLEAEKGAPSGHLEICRNYWKTFNQKTLQTVRFLSLWFIRRECHFTIKLIIITRELNLFKLLTYLYVEIMLIHLLSFCWTIIKFFFVVLFVRTMETTFPLMREYKKKQFQIRVKKKHHENVNCWVV